MKWTYYLSQKLKIAVSLSIIVALILVINLVNKRHFNELQASLTSVYQDRLMVEVYIYEINTYINEISHMHSYQDMQPTNDMMGRKNQIYDSISVLIGDFRNTLLTKQESVELQKLINNLAGLEQLEEDVVFANDDNNSGYSEIEQKIKLINQNLYELSDIQKNEGKLLVDRSTEIIHNSKIALQLEIGILIIIALIVQILIFSSRSAEPRFHQQQHLN